MNKSTYLMKADRRLAFSNWLVLPLHKFIGFLLGQKLVVSLTVEGEGAAQKLLSAYARGVRYFPKSILVQSELSFKQLSYIVLVGAKLTNVDFWATNLTGADLSYTDLKGADLTSANLTGANLTGANLSEASLVGTNFTKAILRDACLCNSNLTGAILQDTNLTNVALFYHSKQKKIRIVS